MAFLIYISGTSLVTPSRFTEDETSHFRISCFAAGSNTHVRRVGGVVAIVTSV